jgi:Predicted acetyltransferase
MAEKSPIKEMVKLYLDGIELGYITFIVVDNMLEINHTVVHPEFRGNNYGKDLVESVIGIAGSRNLDVTSTCSYADRIMSEK